jgi:DNA-directed RNA polymerase subunit RPC12/RpoP
MNKDFYKDFGRTKYFFRSLIIGFPIAFILFELGITVFHSDAMGIVFFLAAAFCLIALPFVYIKYKRIISLKGVYYCITCKNIFSVKALSVNLSLKPEKVVYLITRLVKYRYLSDYMLDGEKTKIISDKKPAIHKEKCSGCGAVYFYTDYNICPYCGIMGTEEFV